MKALITGANGFAGRHLESELKKHGYQVYGIDARDKDNPVDLRDIKALQDVVKQIRPDAVFHLAAQAVASTSWSKPQETMDVNVIGTINLLEVVREEISSAKVLLVGSADQYGVLNGGGKIKETADLCPRTPYGVSKCAQEQIGRIYAETYGMNVCMTRTFSYGGSGQPRGFVIPDFAFGVASVEAGLSKAMHVGNLDSERDFTHIRDVVGAYRLLSEKGKPGEVYNVGSGELHSIREVLQCLLGMADCKVLVEQEQTKVRPKDVRGAACDNTKLTETTGWKPMISFRAMMEEELNDWRNRIKQI